MSDLNWFDWECFYHVDDFAYCLSQMWAVLLLIYLTTAVIFGLFAATIIYLRRRRLQQYQQEHDEAVQVYYNVR